MNQFKDLEKAKQIGIEAYIDEQNEKIGCLKELLEHYNDGRRKSFYCLVVNLLELEDVKVVLESVKSDTNESMTLKEKAATVSRFFEEAAAKKSISTKLRK